MGMDDPPPPPPPDPPPEDDASDNSDTTDTTDATDATDTTDAQGDALDQGVPPEDASDRLDAHFAQADQERLDNAPDVRQEETPEQRLSRLEEGRGLPEDPRTPDWQERGDDYNRYEVKLPDEYPGHGDIHCDSRTGHILYGDNTGGGHLHGENVPTKSEFPPDWNEDRIIGAANDVARNPDRVVDEGDNLPARYTASGERDGVPMRVAVRADGEVWTAYPSHMSWPRN